MHGNEIFMHGNEIFMHGNEIFMHGNEIFMHGNEISLHETFRTDSVSASGRQPGIDLSGHLWGIYPWACNFATRC